MAHFRVVRSDDPTAVATIFVTLSPAISVAVDSDTKLAEDLLQKKSDSEELLNFLPEMIEDWFNLAREEDVIEQVERIAVERVMFDRYPQSNLNISCFLHLSFCHLPPEDWQAIREDTSIYPGSCWIEENDRQGIILSTYGPDERDFCGHGNPDDPCKFSAALHRCIEFAESRGATYIRFDKDGTLVEELEKFDHSNR